MKRREIIKQYIESLKEDQELDYIFPILLERMGYRVLSTPRQSKGQPQHGRDVVAIKIRNGQKHFSYLNSRGLVQKILQKELLVNRMD